MNDAIIAALITGVLSLCGVVISNLATSRRAESKIENSLSISQAVTDTKLEELTREIRDINQLVQRVPVIEAQIEAINHKIKNLEAKNGV